VYKEGVGLFLRNIEVIKITMLKRYQNKQLWSECMLVSLWNAARFHDVPKVPKIGTKEYKKIAIECKCINGACLSDIEKEAKRLGLISQEGELSIKWFKENLPVEFGVHCHRGYHSILVVNVKKDKLLLANYALGRTHWMNWDTFLEKSNKYGTPISYKKKDLIKI